MSLSFTKSLSSGLDFKYVEHTFLGDTINIKTSSGENIEAVLWKFKLNNGLQLTYGEICGLAGDFYGTESPISDGKTPVDQVARFNLAFNVLAEEKSHTPWEAASILKVLKSEIAKVNEAIADKKDSWEVYYTLPDVNVSLQAARV